MSEQEKDDVLAQIPSMTLDELAELVHQAFEQDPAFRAYVEALA